MSIKNRFQSRTLKYAIALTAAVVISACSSDDDNDDVDNAVDNGESAIDAGTGQAVSVSLDASQEIPAQVDENGVVTATLGVSNLTGPAVMAHIHRGFAGSTGPVLIGLTTEDGGSTWTVPADARALTDEEVGAFNRGELYFNVHTAANAPGEIRGQIDAGNATRFLVRLENISTVNTLNVASTGTTQPVPLSPGAYIVHRNAIDSPLLLPRDAANAGLEAVAEDGNTMPYPGSYRCRQ